MKPKLPLAGLCGLLAGCGGYSTEWDFPYPKYYSETDTTEEKADYIVKTLDERNSSEKFPETMTIESGSKRFRIDFSVAKDSVVLSGKAFKFNIGIYDLENLNVLGDLYQNYQFVGLADNSPFDFADFAFAHNYTDSTLEMNPNLPCLLDLREAVIDAGYDNLTKSEFKLPPYFSASFDELMNRL